MLDVALEVSLFTLFSYTAGDLISKNPSQKIGSLPTTLLALGSSFVLFSFLLILRGFSMPLSSCLYSVIAGLFFAGGLLFSFKPLESEQVSDTLAMVGFAYIVPVVFAAVYLKERVPLLSYVGVLLILTGSTIIAFKKNKFNKMLIPAIIGNIMWGIQFIFFNYALKASSNYIDVAFVSSFVGFSVALVYSFFKSKVFINFKYASQAILSGILLALGILGSIYMIMIRVMVLGLSIVASEPAFITLLGKIVYKDVINKPQLLGVIMAISGIFLITVY